MFEACEALVTETPDLDRSSDAVRGYLYEPYEAEPLIVRRQLSACSLVCKAWTLPAQLRMLHSAKLYRASQAQSLLAFLSSARILGNAVQVLELGRNSADRRDHRALSRWHVFEILRRCHRIQMLSLLQWRPDDQCNAVDPRSPFLPPITLDVLSRHDPFERLTTLRLHQYTGSLQSLADLLVLIPVLETFSFEGNLTTAVIDGDYPPAPFSLRRLSVAGYGGGFLGGFGWILGRSWNTLNRLDLGLLSGPIDEDLLAGIRANGSSIQYLSITLCQIDVAAIIKCCPNLRALRIDGTHSLPHAPHFMHSLRHCLAALSPETSNTPLSSPVTTLSLHAPQSPSTSPAIHLRTLNLVFIGTLSGKYPLGKSPSAREMEEFVYDLRHLDALSRLQAVTLEFCTRYSYSDAPLTELRMIADVCTKRRISIQMPDLYDLVMGTRVSDRSDRRYTRHGRFFSMHT